MKKAMKKGMKKRMGCKADGEVKYRSNLMVVRILTRRPTKQTAFYSPRQSDERFFSFKIFFPSAV